MGEDNDSDIEIKYDSDANQVAWIQVGEDNDLDMNGSDGIRDDSDHNTVVGCSNW